MGLIGTKGLEAPSTDIVRCVHRSAIKETKVRDLIWCDKGSGATSGIAVFASDNELGSAICTKNRNDKTYPGTVYRLKGVKPGTTSSIWKEEKQVLASPSVKWGTWLLELLICDAKSVYDLKLFDALVQFLRSPESPMKSRVVRLWTSLLREPKMFPAPGPRVESLQGIMSEVLRECKRRSSASKLFLPSVL